MSFWIAWFLGSFGGLGAVDVLSAGAAGSQRFPFDLVDVEAGFFDGFEDVGPGIAGRVSCLGKS